MVVAPTPTTESLASSCCESCLTSGERLLARVKGAVQAGNARHVIVKHTGHVVVDVPLTIGIVGVLAAPQVAALGALAALVTECSVSVERREPDAAEPHGTPSNEPGASSDMK